MHYRMFNTFPDPCPLEASSTLPPTNTLNFDKPNDFQTLTNVPGLGGGWRQNYTILRTTDPKIDLG